MRAVADLPCATLPGDYQTAPGGFLARMYQAHGPIFRVNAPWGGDVVYLVGPEANRYVLSTHRRHFSHYDGWNLTEGAADAFGVGLLFMDREVHTAHRRVLGPAFAATHMDSYLPRMHLIIEEIIGRWGAAGEIDIYQQAHRIAFEIVATVFLGLPASVDVERLRWLFVELGSLNILPIGPRDDGEARAKCANLRGAIAEVLLPAIRERRQRALDDALGAMVSARDHCGNALSDDQLLAHAMNLLLAGHITTASLCAWLFCLLSQHPEYGDRVLAEQVALLDRSTQPTYPDTARMEVLMNALLETERLHPPIANLPRGVVEDFEFSEYRVPRGTLVFCSIAGSHMIPTIFADPDTFDPDRFAPPRREHLRTPYSLIGFSVGPRTCLGITAAKVEIKAIVSQVFRRYRLTLSPEQDLVPVYDPISVPLNGMKMKVSPL